VVGVLDLGELVKRAGELEDGLVGLHESLLLHDEASLGKDVGHLGLAGVTAPVLVLNLVLVVHEVVLLATDNAEVGGGLLAEAVRDLEFSEPSMVGWVSHVFEDDALLHLTDEFFLDHTHEVGECVVDSVCVELVVLTHALGEEVLTAVTCQDRHGIGGDGVDVVGEPKFSLNVELVHLAEAYALLECVRVFGVEEEGEAGHFLLNGLGANRHNLELVVGPVVANDLDGAPGVLLVDVHGGEGVRLIGSLGTVVEPLLDGLVLLPGIVTSQYLDTGHLGVPENFILLLEDGNGFFGCDVLLADLLLLVIFREEGGFLNNVLMLLNEVGVSCWKTLQLHKNWLVILFKNDR
jgi:hypothetical protein